MGLRRAFQGFLVAFGVISIGIALVHLAVGPEAIIGGSPANATSDGEDRFYAGIFAAFGAALLWCARDVERKQAYVNALAGAFLVGGIGRLISLVVVGAAAPVLRRDARARAGASGAHGAGGEAGGSPGRRDFAEREIWAVIRRALHDPGFTFGKHRLRQRLISTSSTQAFAVDATRLVAADAVIQYRPPPRSNHNEMPPTISNAVGMPRSASE
ncbi:MAG: hypothetical protein QOH60_957 [Mycobacterium sp.]|nr:hypothetical protein [Mycobacterium sp.]